MRPGFALATLLCLAFTAGCGDDQGEPGSSPRANAAPTTLVAALGDSITAGTPLWDPDPAMRDLIGPALDRESQYEYWAERKLGGGSRRVRFRNCGVNRQRTDEIAARLDRCTRGAQALIVQGGINDIAQGRPVEEAAANLRAMVRRGKRKRLRVALVEVLPWNAGYPDAAGPIRALNRRIAAIGREESVPVLPWFRALEADDGRDRMRPELTIDGSHPSVEGYRRLGQTIELPPAEAR